MANLKVISGGLSPKPSFSVNARGIAKYMIAGPYAQRKVIEDYAFPKDGKAKIILPAAAKDVISRYFKSGQNDGVLHNAVADFSVTPPYETAHARSRRTGALRAARILLKSGKTFSFTDVRNKRCDIVIEGLPVRASIDFFSTLPDGRVIGVIFNVAVTVSDDKTQLDHYAAVESEIAWQATRISMPVASEIWYIDLLSEKVVRKHKKPLKNVWRNVETTADNMQIAYNTLIARRARQKRA